MSTVASVSQELRFVRLDEVARINPPADRGMASDEKVSFVPLAALDILRACTPTVETRTYGEVSSGYTPMRDGDLLVAKITPSFENGKVGQATLNHDCGFGSTEFHVVRTSADIYPRYLLHFLRRDEFRLQGAARMTGSAGQKRIPASFLAQLKIPLPPLAEQRRIAAILDHADALRAKRRQVLAHLDSLPQAIFHAMFGDREWASTLDGLADVQIGPFGSLLHREDYVSGGVAVINPMHIQDGAIQADPEFSVSEEKASRLSLYRLAKDDVVLARRGEMGRAGIAAAEHRGMLCGTGSIILRPRQANSRFLHAVVTSPRMKGYLAKNSLGSTLPNLNAGIVMSAPAPQASIAVQTEFATKLARVERMRGDAQRASTIESVLFASLQSRAFRGEL